MNNYRVSFFKLTRETDKATGKSTTSGSEFMGSVVVNDMCLGPNESLVSYAFRTATPVQQLSDKTVTERL